jgi:hypothetical protein
MVHNEDITVEQKDVIRNEGLSYSQVSVAKNSATDSKARNDYYLWFV